MAQYDALLKIKAQVDGEGAIAGLAKGLGGLKNNADEAGKGLGGMLSRAGGLSGALGSLIPLVSGIGFAAFAKGAIDAADNMNDLSQKTGVSVESLSQWKQAAEAGGTTIDTVGKAMQRLSRGMVQAGTDTEDYSEKAAESLEKATNAVKDGEDRQVEAVKDAAEKRLQELEDETSDRLREINKRYKQEQRLLDDSFSDAADAAETAAKDQQDRDSEIIKARYEARKKIIQNDKSLSEDERSELMARLKKNEDAEQDALDKSYKAKQKERSRQFRDEKQEREDALEERKRLEEKKLKEAADAAKAITKDSADSQVELIKDSTKQQLESLKDLEGGPKGVAKALKELGISMTDAAGNMKSTDQVMKEIADKFAAMPEAEKKASLAFRLFGKSGTDLIPVLNAGRDGVESFSVTMTTKFAKAADQLNDKTVEMGAKLLVFGVELGTKLMPHLESLSDMLILVADGFAALPKWQQETIVAAGGLILVLGPLTKAIQGVMLVSNVLMGIKLGATIAGWAGAIGPAFIIIQTAFAGLLAFLTGTIGPALLAFFSGPVGWTVLAVAAVVAMAIAFREPLGKFLTWLGSEFKKGWDKFVDNILKKPITNYFKWWKSNWEKASDVIFNVFKKVDKLAKGLAYSMGDVIKKVFRAVVVGLVNAFNQAINIVNVLITQFRNIPFIGVPLKDFKAIPYLPIPRFAKGGVVSRPTVAMVGEGGESEYIIPESKMDKALNRFMVKAQGMNAGGGNPTINITTGPVMQMGGEQYVTLSDMRAAMQATAKGVFDSLRNPSTRIALGLA
jgi:hypothetical protein